MAVSIANLPFYMKPMYSLGMTALFVLTFIMLVMIIFLTGKVTMPMLKAKLLGRHMIALVRKDKKLQLITGKYHAGIAKTKRGPFVVRNEGTYSMGGSTVSIAYEDYALPLSAREVVAANILESEGYDEYMELPQEIENKVLENYEKAENASPGEVLKDGN